MKHTSERAFRQALESRLNDLSHTEWKVDFYG
jgi:hypothetical protein